MIRLVLDLFGVRVNVKVSRTQAATQDVPTTEVVNNTAADVDEAPGFGFQPITARAGDE